MAIEKRIAKRQVPHEMTIVQKSRICIFRDFAANDLHIVWSDDRNGINREIYYKHSSNNGNTWSDDERLTNAVLDSYAPSIDVDGNTIHIAWSDSRDGVREIYYKQSADNGTTWTTGERLTYNIRNASSPKIAANGDNIHIIWVDDRDLNEEIYYIQSTERKT